MFINLFENVSVFNWMIWIITIILIIIIIVFIFLIRNQCKIEKKKIDKSNNNYQVKTTGLLKNVPLSVLYLYVMLLLIVGILLTNFIGLQLYAKGTFMFAKVTHSYTYETLADSDTNATVRHHVIYEYKINEQIYSETGISVKSYKIGQTILIRYQDDLPEKSIIALGINYQIIFIFLLLMVLNYVMAIIYKKMKLKLHEKMEKLNYE